MGKIRYWILACVVAASACWFASAEKIKAPKEDAPPKVTKFESIEATEILTKRITMKSGDGKHEISMFADRDSVSIFVSGKGTQSVMLRSARDGTYIGLQTKKIPAKQQGCPIAIIAGDESAEIQLSEGGDIRHVSVRKLLDLLGKKKEK